MKFIHLMAMTFVLSSCTTNPEVRQAHLEPKYDLNISVTDIGGFRLQMTPRAALAVIKAKGYRESSRNRVTLDDLVENPKMPDTTIEVFEFSYGESLDDRLLRETGIFELMFEHGRVYEISYSLNNLTKEKLKGIRDQNEYPYRFITNRETKNLNNQLGGVATSWIYEPNRLAFLRVNYIEREPRFAQPRLGEPGVGSCEYSITVSDENPNLIR